MSGHKNRSIVFQEGVADDDLQVRPLRLGVQTGSQQTLYHLDGEYIETIYNAQGQPQATFLRGAVDEIVRRVLLQRAVEGPSTATRTTG